MNYHKVYNDLIVSRLDLNRSKSDQYYESHHITPLCLGGCKRCKDNLILLTPREHFLAHWLLTRMYPDNDKIKYAFWCMCIAVNKNQSRHIFSSIAYQEARLNYSSIRSQRMKGKVGYWKNKIREDRKGENHPMYGKGYKQLGENNPMYGKPAPNRRSVILINDDTAFESLTEAAKYLNISTSTACLWIKTGKVIQYA